MDAILKRIHFDNNIVFKRCFTYECTSPGTQLAIANYKKDIVFFFFFLFMSYITVNFLINKFKSIAIESVVSNEIQVNGWCLRCQMFSTVRYMDAINDSEFLYVGLVHFYHDEHPSICEVQRDALSNKFPDLKRDRH